MKEQSKKGSQQKRERSVPLGLTNKEIIFVNQAIAEHSANIVSLKSGLDNSQIIKSTTEKQSIERIRQEQEKRDSERKFIPLVNPTAKPKA